MKKIKLLLFLFSVSHFTYGTTWNIGISGFAFNPATATITLGDEVNFMLNNSTHNAVEVSLATYNANGTTPLAGGFSFPVGSGGLVPQAKLTLGTHYYVCTPHVASFSMKGTITVLSSGCTIPSKPPPITGNTSVCSNTLNNYSVTAVAGATSYTWTLPAGWTGNSTANSINVTSGSTSGNIIVTANSSCGNSDPTTLAVSTSTPPGQPGVISGNTAICLNSTNVYSIASVPGASSYTWSLPAGWSGNSSSTSITATAGSGSGNVSVTANNSCGSSVTRSLSIINSGPPAQPGNITGSSSVCANTNNIYSVPVVPGATSYTWTLPAGWNGNSNSSSITALAGSAGGNLSVVANGNCGISLSRTLTITTVSIPPTPGNISGNTSVCSNSVNNYSVSAVAGAISYTWILPAGWSGSSVTNNITVTAGANSGNISVTANNNCGSSLANITSVTSVGAIGQPGPITGNTTVCMSSSNTYTINPVNGATSYTWTLPMGWIGNSSTNTITTTAGSTSGNVTVLANSSCGQSPVQTLAVSTTNLPSPLSAISGNATVCANSTNTYSVTAIPGVNTYNWSLPSGWTGSSTTNSIVIIASPISGNITVSTSNACGTSAQQTKTIAVNSVPLQPSAIAGNINVCAASTNVYTVTAVPGVTSYTWTVPAGWIGSSTSNSISVVAGSTSGVLTVSANNTCGASLTRTLDITTIAPPKPGNILGNNSICVNSTNEYSVTEVNGATSYTWTLPAGWSGTSTTNLISAIAGPLSGNITVSANNSCGSSPVQTLAATVNKIPAQPTMISGKADICANSSNTYNIASDSGATNFTWTLPSGWTGNSTSNTINTVSNSLGGNITVTANSTCGMSPIQTLSVTISILPTQPANISGNSTVCVNSTNLYQVPVIPGSTSYSWTIPVGWTGSSTTNSITTIASSTGGNITVSANNGCGSSPIQTLATSVSSLPVKPSGIIGNASVCENSTNDYSIDEVPGATFYSWIMPPGWTINSTSNFITTLSGTTGGNIMVSAHNTCGTSPSQTLAVQIGHLSKTVNQSGNTFTAVAVGVGYQWINCDTKTPIAGQTNQSFTATANGNYAVIVKQNNCTDTSSCFIVGSVPTHESEGFYKINIFPNPAKGMVYIEQKEVNKGKMEIYDVLGKPVYTAPITSLITPVDITQQVPGIYFINFNFDQFKFTRRVVIQ